MGDITVRTGTTGRGEIYCSNTLLIMVKGMKELNSSETYQKRYAMRCKGQSKNFLNLTANFEMMKIGTLQRKLQSNGTNWYTRQKTKINFRYNGYEQK